MQHTTHYMWRACKLKKYNKINRNLNSNVETEKYLNELIARLF